jgi:co-chaperonin GroES (HSP10)
MTDVERLTLLGARIFVRPDKPQDKIGNIFIPDNAKKPASTGVVVAFGPGMLTKKGKRWPMPPINRGDRVVYQSQNPYPVVKLDGVKLLSMYDDDVLAVVDP